MKKTITESQLRNIIKESIKKTLKEIVEGESPKYYLDIDYYHIQDIPSSQFSPGYHKGESYGDIGYANEMWEYGMNSFEDAKKAAINLVLDKSSGFQRSEEELDPVVVSVIYATPYSTDNKRLFSVANCSQTIAQELGIKADEYIETLNR